MSSERPALEIADILRRHGATLRAAHAGHRSLGQLKVMAAIEACRTAALGGHVEGCQDCGHRRIAYNSCTNRHCPKCQAAAARTWLETREADLLPVSYFHVVFIVAGPRWPPRHRRGNRFILPGIWLRRWPEPQGWTNLQR